MPIPYKMKPITTHGTSATSKYYASTYCGFVPICHHACVRFVADMFWHGFRMLYGE